MTAPTTTAPDREPGGDSREEPATGSGTDPGSGGPAGRAEPHQDPFDRDTLPTPRAPPPACCAPCSPRCAPASW